MDASPSSSQPAPGTEEKLDRLKALLREMFQLDRGDLDFGLYRIMNMKSGKIVAFLDNDLLPQVKSTLAGIGESDRVSLEQERHKAFHEAGRHRRDPENSPEVVALDKRLAAAKADAADEADAYNHLALFFSRYYTEGDFMSLRRYSGGGESEYLIPYGGEEVKLHWANADQYYIKTTENYAAYTFIVNGRRVRFEIAAADNEKDNIKEANGNQRRFVLAAGGDAIAAIGDELTIRFAHRPLTNEEKKTWKGNGRTQQTRINEVAEKQVLKSLEPDWQAPLAALAPTDTNGERTLLAKHLERYTAKNDFDYFIHKDLDGFLTRELDLYLKEKVLNLDDLAAGDSDRLDRALRRMRAVKVIAEKIIAFLSQLENFQKTLWLKKKFVLETNWCVTLDRIPESLYAEIVKNKAQIEEWVKLFAIDELNGDLVATADDKPLKSEFLKENPYLVLDTRHFDQKFSDKLLAALSEAGPLDEQMDGLLVHGENFQALNLLQERYRGQVQCVYIDPPYNSKTSEILYKNTYKHSSWVSLIDNRLEISRQLSAPDGSHIVAIDENEQEVLGHLLSKHFPEFERVCVAIIHNKKGIQGDYFSYTHDYAYFCMPSSLPCTHGKPIPQSEWEYSNLRKWGRESERATAKNCFYPIYVENGKIVGFGDVCEEEFHPDNANVPCGQSRKRIAVYPVDPKGMERKWRYARASIERIPHLLKVHTTRKEEIQILKAQPESQVKTVWDDSMYIAGDYGTRWLTDLGLKFSEDLYSKSIHTVVDSIRTVSESHAVVCDYFAGSGTSGHAVININRENGGCRKYILVEIGHHFEDILLPRIKKVVYSKEWKDGKPQDREGISQLFKHIRLESYEDTLDGLTLTLPNTAQQDMLDSNPTLAEDYRLRYALGEETAASACLLGMDCADPFAYTLSVVRDGERKEESADLPETFNFLLGLRMESRRHIDGILAMTGTDAEGRHCLILWRNLNETDNAALDKWFTKHLKTFKGAFDLIYANGDHTLNAMKQPGETWTAMTIEPVFRELMFNENA